MAVYYLYEIFALLSQVWINDVYEVSLWMAVFWLVAVPGQMFYLFNCKLQKKGKANLYKKTTLLFCLAIFGSIIYVAIVSKVIRVQQRALIESLKKINLQLKQQRSHLLKWAQINQQYLSLCRFMEVYSGRSQTLLSVSLPYIITVQCYMLLTVLFRLEQSFADLTTAALYLLIIAFFELFLLFIIGLCAKVVRLNGAFETANRRFYLKLVFSKEAQLRCSTKSSWQMAMLKVRCDLVKDFV